MQFDTWKISGSGFHFGEHGLGQEETLIMFPSDSLYAALLARFALFEGKEKTASFVRPFLDKNPPFLLTSTFPYAGKVRFFPHPLLPRSKKEEHGIEESGYRIKDIKKIKFVSERIFRGLISGEPLTSYLRNPVFIQGEQVLLTEAEVSSLPEEVRQRKHHAKIWAVEQRPRVTIDRRTNKSEIYHTGRVIFAPDCGLWFAIRWLDETYKPAVDALFADLSYTGLGGERSSGFGACNITRDSNAPIDFPVHTQDKWITLSRFLPSKEDLPALLNEHARYTIKRIGGWVTSPSGMGQRRRSINLVSDGAYLGASENMFPGMIADIRPKYPTNPDPLNHPVYRIGYAFPVACTRGEQ